MFSQVRPGDPTAAAGAAAPASPGLDDSQPGAGTGGRGAVEPPDDAFPQVAPVEFVCDASALPAGTRFRRLTQHQYQNTLRDLLRLGLNDEAEVEAVLAEIGPLLERLPADARKVVAEDLHGSYRRLDQDVAQTHVDGWIELALRIGSALSSAPRRASLAGECAADGDAQNEPACVEAFVRGFGARALRRPLDQAEVAFHAGFYGDMAQENPAGYADVVAGLLSAPQFLYLVEHGADALADKPDVHALSAFELAARLSYHFWESMPDAALFAAAEDGSLLQPDVYLAQVERLFADPRTRATVREFYRDWLKLEDLPDLTANTSSAQYREFAGAALPGPELREHMIDEVLDLVEHFTWEQPAGFGELLATERSFARTGDLAAIYGVPVWDGAGEPPAFAAGVRPGLLTRAAFLASASANTRPVMKGLFIRRNMLCDTIPPPPDNAANNPPEPSETLSTRQVVEALTEQPGTSCAGCHATLINPLGFATEGFDALGRVRDRQRLLAEDGTEIGSAEIDTRSVPRVTADDASPSQGPADLMRLIAASGKAEACFVRHYFRFSFGRFEDLRSDGCALERMRRALIDSGSVAAMLREVALAGEFQQRNFAGAEP